MYKTVLHALVFFFLVLCGLGCTSSPMPDSHNEDGDDNHQGRVLSEGIVLKEGVFYFGGDDQQYISVLDTNKIAVKANIPSQMKFGIGDVVLVDFSQKAPLGFAGKVISQKEESGEAVFYTKPVSLEEIYEELSIDSDIDVYKDADSVVDDEGQVYELAPVEDSDIAQMTEGGDDPVKGLTDKDFTSFKSIPIESTYFNGRLFVCSHAHVKINITKGKVEEYDILLERQSYLASRLSVEITGKLDLTVLREKDFCLPVGIPVCPGMVLQPILSPSMDLHAEGAMRLQSKVYVKFEDTSVRFHNGEYTNNSTNTPVFKITPAYMDCEASVELVPRVALKFDVWGLKLIGFGVDVKGSFKFTLSDSMKMSAREQLKKDVKANVEIGGSIGLFCYAKFLKGNDLRAAISFPSLSYEVDLLDKGKNHAIKKEVGEWSVTGEFGDEEVFLDVKKSGYALFRIGEEEPLEKAFLEDMTVVKTTSGERGFNVPANSFDYYVCTCNYMKDDEGNEYFFYGPVLGPFISKLNIGNGHGGGEIYSFTYDEYGRLAHLNKQIIGASYDENISFAYTDNEINLNWGWKQETIKLDSYGRIVSYSGDGMSRTFSYPSMSQVAIYEVINEVYTYTRNLQYSSGSLQNQSLSYTYPGGAGSDSVGYSYTSCPDQYSIDFVHTLLDDLKMHTLPPFLAFPGIRNSRLVSTMSVGEATLSVSYQFGEDKLVRQFSWREGTDALRTVTVTYNTDI